MLKERFMKSDLSPMRHKNKIIIGKIIIEKKVLSIENDDELKINQKTDRDTAESLTKHNSETILHMKENKHW